MLCRHTTHPSSTFRSVKSGHSKNCSTTYSSCTAITSNRSCSTCYNDNRHKRERETERESKTNPLIINQTLCICSLSTPVDLLSSAHARFHHTTSPPLLISGHQLLIQCMVSVSSLSGRTGLKGVKSD